MTINDKAVEQKLLFPYLGVLLDPMLSFAKHIENIASKTRKAMNKICGLFKGRRRISVELGIHLYIALVRPHLEYAAPVWAGITVNQWNILEKVQHQCLKKILGAHSNSSSNATEVVAGVMPLRFRTRELCVREYIKIISRHDNNEIKKMLLSAKSIRNTFTPMSYLVSVSRNTVKKIGEIKGNLAQETKLEPKDIINQCGPSRVSLIEKIGCSKSRSVEQKAIGKESIENFVTEHKGINIMAFTDGSVKNRADENLPQTLGYGACSFILIPVGNSVNISSSNKHVG